MCAKNNDSISGLIASMRFLSVSKHLRTQREIGFHICIVLFWCGDVLAVSLTDK
jgi:hypothetical protein